MLAWFRVPIGWGELFKRTAKETWDDDCLGLAAQLAYYFLLALFPALLFLLALASFFPIDRVTDEVMRGLANVAPSDVVQLITEQMRRISESDQGGLLTLGILGALWSSSSALVGLISALNTAYDIKEGRAWWKVRLLAVGLTVALAIFLLISSTLVLAGPEIASKLANMFGLGAAFTWTWNIAQWPFAFALVVSALALVYYYGPDAEQDWVWITPGAALATVLWLGISLGFRVYLQYAGDYNATYGTIGGVIILLLWLYLSGFAILVGAEMNAEIEHASPYGKAPGEKVPGERRRIGPAAGRARYHEHGKGVAAQ
jgi:membrane protein